MDADALVDTGTEVLSEAECEELLRHCSVGRVALSIGAVPAVFPVNFATLDGMIVFRTASGTKLDGATRKTVVAFEVDEVDPLYHEGWSVLAVGICDELRDPEQVERVNRLGLAAWADGVKDHTVAIRPEFISGRRIVHRAAPAPTEH